MQHVSLDFETRSTTNLTQTGVYPYAQHPDTDIWCACFAITEDREDIDEVLVWQRNVHNKRVAHALEAVAADPDTLFHAHNAQFERIIWHEIMHKRYDYPDIPVERWRCTLAQCATMALPRALADAARVLGLGQEKDSTGHRLMLQMAKPRQGKPGDPVTWWDDEDRVNRLVDYCKQDVVVEHAIQQALPDLTPSEQQAYELDQRINDRGIVVDNELVESIDVLAAQAQEDVDNAIKATSNYTATGANDREGLILALADSGLTTKTLKKDAVQQLITDDATSDRARKLLKLRQEGAKSSLAKTAKFRSAQCTDGRVRGMMQFYGANTGRWSGRLLQVQNIAARSAVLGNNFDVAEWLPIVKRHDYSTIDTFYPPKEVLSMMLRPCLVAPEGGSLIGADYNAIEARVLAWLANETWLLHAFRQGQDPYKLMAADIYHMRPEDVQKGSRERFLSKSAVLGAGYGMGHVKFQDQCAKDGVRLADEESKDIIDTYRERNQQIVSLWYETERAALTAVRHPGQRVSFAGGKLVFVMYRKWLMMVLPHHLRALAFFQPRIVDRETPWGTVKPSIEVYGQNPYTHKWGWQSTYGAWYVQSATQGTARDVLLEGMLNLERAGYPVLMSVHDEIVTETQAAPTNAPIAKVEKIICSMPEWAAGIPLKAEGFASKHYQK